ncbi:MAG: hypothetical protein AAGA54_27045 [Myxococcota bacterium]
MQRSARFAAAFLLAALTGCGEDETPRDVDVTIGTASISARTDPPDGLATLDATIEMDATVDLSGAEVLEARITALPSGPELTFDINVRGPMDGTTIDLPANEVVVARVTNAGTTNAELAEFCGAAVSFEVTVEAEGIERSASRDVTVSCS